LLWLSYFINLSGCPFLLDHYSSAGGVLVIGSSRAQPLTSSRLAVKANVNNPLIASA